MKVIKLLTAVCMCILMVAGTVSAKDLKGKVGLGFNSQLSQRGMDSISAKYWLKNDLGFQGIFGFTFSDDYDEVNLGGKVMYKLVDEENMYVAGVGGLGFARVDPDVGDDDTGWWLSGGLGMEYFFSGLPNLGFSAELSLVFSDYYDQPLTRAKIIKSVILQASLIGLLAATMYSSYKYHNKFFSGKPLDYPPDLKKKEWEKKSSS